MCWVWLALAVPFSMMAFGFTGPPSHVVNSRGAAEFRTTMGVRERMGSLHRKGSTGGGKPVGVAPKGVFSDPKALVRALNSQIKRADSATKLISILNMNVDADFLDPIHTSTAYDKLAQFKQKDGSLPSICRGNPSLVKLQARTEAFIKQGQMRSRAFANVMWAIAVLHVELQFVVSLLPSIVKEFQVQARGMNAFDLSNSLWAVAQLKDVAHDVLKIVPTTVTKIPGKAEGMNPQDLSNNLWAVGQLRDVASDVLKIVPTLVAQILGKADGMVPQALFNCLLAAAQIKDEAPNVLAIVPEIVSQVLSKAPKMNALDRAQGKLAFQQLKDVAPDVLKLEPFIRSQAD